MKSLIRIMVFPIVAVLRFIIWLCFAILHCSTWLLSLASTILSILAITVLVTSSVPNGIILFTFAFLISPLGIPMAAAWLLGKLGKI